MDVRVWGTVDDRLIELRAEPGGAGSGIHIEGLPHGRARTTGDRVRAAIVNSGLLPREPAGVIRLDPPIAVGATSDLDLPIALAALAQLGVIRQVGWIFAGGRLGLDGRIHIDSDECLSIVSVVTDLRSAAP
ncbi:MAG: magnesium chelatase domain-containing protein [Actinomycetota bacterium]